MKKIDLAEKIKRRLGAPMVKIELDPTQIYDAIDYAKNKFVKWAIGQATQETWFTVMLSAGQNVYDLPIGVTEIIRYDDSGSTSGGGINHLFTIDNFMYNQGMFQGLVSTGNQYTLVSYHIARDFLETLTRYTPTQYNYKYHRYTNQLEVHPAPPSGSVITVLDDDGNPMDVDSPGFMLVQAHMIEGSSIDGWSTGDTDESFYGLDWIFDYALAECKIILGRIRTKYAQFASIGNTGISLDGDTLISEGIEEKRELKETLMLEECWTGMDILIG